MAEDEAIFDPTLKKKKKETTFDIDAALAEGNANETSEIGNRELESKEDENRQKDDDVEYVDLDLDFTKKKRKKRVNVISIKFTSFGRKRYKD
ncbi:hypothetical protein WA026_007831 [Henosepilachna vigintioctopunctata]|uniref:Uncharacterized protein n=1 Tax=Henosepilachna vigintioctopunctata TaxID=420089 RepID=A0AAW1TYT7_9CUCU